VELHFSWRKLHLYLRCSPIFARVQREGKLRGERKTEGRKRKSRSYIKKKRSFQGQGNWQKVLLVKTAGRLYFILGEGRVMKG